ncbi:Npun_F0296 family exosortase-dependent surface protein [Sphingomonas sp. Leaf21]|uniref:Npun_F0296 family exosortase-dependent surface protein n=1 Tax=Sphingomonas sp. Leaf21 TaxID=2876550 RepID=UPI001E5A09F0|nr:PEP-CTERM sorting domain-containing protein [Sphingomonas sp. Leaf21]
MPKVKTVLLTIAAALVSATSAQAAPGTITSVANDDYSKQSTPPAGSTVVDFNNGLPNGFSLQGGQIASSSSWGGWNWNYLAPAGDNTKFLVTAANGTTTLNADRNFGYGGIALNWGSIDNENRLDILDTMGQVIRTLTGTDVSGGLFASSNRYVTYTLDPASGQQIGGLRFMSPNSMGYAFEVDDVSFFGATPTSVPEPASIALFGAGLLGLAGLARRRRVAARLS